VAELIAEARDAVARESWAEAYQRLRALDPSGLSPRDLEGLADAAWWLCRMDESFAARQRAYAGYADAGDDPAAAMVAGRPCIDRFWRGEVAAGAGWLMRAQRHLRDRPECLQHGHLALCEAFVAHRRGELEAALPLTERAIAIGQRFGDRDLVAMGIHAQGLALVAAGRVAEGMALLDEAMTSVVAGELSRYFTGAIYCNVMAACLEVGDLGRAGEWSEAARAWYEGLSPESPYPGFCRVNRSEVALLLGAWSEAEAEATRACQELTFHPAAAGRAFYETGEIRRRMGDLAGMDSTAGRSRRPPGRSLPGTRWPTTSRPTRRGSSCRCAAASAWSGSPARATATWSAPGSTASRPTAWWSPLARMGSRASRRSRPSSTPPSCSSTPASTATRRSSARAPCWWSAPATPGPTSAWRSPASTGPGCPAGTSARSRSASGAGAGACSLPYSSSSGRTC